MFSFISHEKYKDSLLKIENAFNFKNKAFSKVPLIIQTNPVDLVGYDPNDIPDDYFENPKSMLNFQTKGFEEHFEKLEDDYIPSLFPYYGSTVIPGAFGSKVEFFKKRDPQISDFGIKNIEDIRNVKPLNFENNSMTRRVLDTIKYFKNNSQYPISVSGVQSPLNCISMIIGYENLFYWMRDRPEEVDHLFETVTDNLINWVKLKKEYVNEKTDCANGLFFIKPPDGIGVCLSDDDAVILSPSFYERFVIDKYSRLFTSFGSGMIHWCGNANHQLNNVKNIKGIKAIVNYFLGDINAAVTLQEEVKDKKICLIAGDFIPVDEELDDYLKNIKEKLDPAGLVLQFSIFKKLGLKNGRYCETERDVIKTALKIINFFRG